MSKPRKARLDRVDQVHQDGTLYWRALDTAGRAFLSLTSKARAIEMLEHYNGIKHAPTEHDPLS